MTNHSAPSPIGSLAEKWRDSEAPACTCSEGQYFHTLGCPLFAWKNRRISQEAIIKRQCADELSASLATLIAEVEGMREAGMSPTTIAYNRAISDVLKRLAAVKESRS